jgi:hypothetical protein
MPFLETIVTELFSVDLSLGLEVKFRFVYTRYGVKLHVRPVQW